MVALLPSCSYQCLHIFWKAGASIADTRINEFVADPRIRANSLSDHIDICPHQLTEVGDVVHETDLGSEHGVGCILCHFGRRNVHEQYWMTVQGEGIIEFAHQFLCTLTVHTHHNAVGFHEILNGGALF